MVYRVYITWSFCIMTIWMFQKNYVFAGDTLYFHVFQESIILEIPFHTIITVSCVDLLTVSK